MKLQEALFWYAQLRVFIALIKQTKRDGETRPFFISVDGVTLKGEVSKG